MRGALLNENTFDSLDDLSHWRHNDNTVRPRASLAIQTPQHARREVEKFDGSAPGARASNREPGEASFRRPVLEIARQFQAGRKSVSFTGIACMMTDSLRARAIRALRMFDLRAIVSAQSFSFSTLCIG